MKRATVTQAEIRRAIKAAAECGLSVRACVIGVDEVRLEFVSGGGVDIAPPLSEARKPIPWPKLPHET